MGLDPSSLVGDAAGVDLGIAQSVSGAFGLPLDASCSFDQARRLAEVRPHY
jgi:hypothetical protein